MLLVHRLGGDQTLPLDVRPIPPGMTVVPTSEPGDQVWEILGMRTMPVSTDWVAAVSPKLRGGLYVEAVSPNSPAAQAAIQKGDVLVGMNVGKRYWETIRPDNILYILRQPEAIQTQGAVLYVVRQNGLQSRRISLAEARVKKASQ
jgi:serine protease Do